MTVARSTVALVGTNWTTGVSIATATTTTGSVVDVLGNTSSEGELDLFLVYTFPNSAPTAGGTVAFYCYGSWDTSSADAGSDNAPILYSDTAVQNTTHHVEGARRSTERYMTGAIFNSATGQTITNAALLGNLNQRS